MSDEKTSWGECPICGWEIYCSDTPVMHRESNYHSYCWQIKKDRDRISELEKASGGEKSVNESQKSIDGSKGSRLALDSTDSKPPEPNKNDYLLRHYIIDSDEPREDDEPVYQPIKSDALESLLHALPDYFKLNWWKEQIKHFVPGYDLVKREDLIRYARKLRIWGDGEWKHIKEEYNID